MSTWPPLALADANDKDSCAPPSTETASARGSADPDSRAIVVADLSTLTAYLAKNPPHALAASTVSLSSPEGSDGSSPSSSDGNAHGQGAAAANQSGAPTDKRKQQEAKTATAALKDRRASNGSLPVDGTHTHPDAFDDDDGPCRPPAFRRRRSVAHLAHLSCRQQPRGRNEGQGRQDE